MKFWNFKLGIWGLVTSLFIYVFVIGMYGKYIINVDMDSIIQAIATLFALMYTVWQVKLISNFINKF